MLGGRCKCHYILNMVAIPIYFGPLGKFNNQTICNKLTSDRLLLYGMIRIRWTVRIFKISIEMTQLMLPFGWITFYLIMTRPSLMNKEDEKLENK